MRQCCSEQVRASPTRKEGRAALVLLQRLVFGVLSGFWLVLGMLAVFGIVQLGVTDGAWILGTLMIGNGVALCLAGWFSLRGRRVIDYLALAVVAANALMSVTDEIGVLDLLSLTVNGGLILLMVVNLRSKPSGSVRRSV